MATYLERYCDGEHEDVWNELVKLGESVRQEPTYADALAVARETMRRVRANIEILIQRLIHIGFVFGYDHRLLEQLPNTQSALDWGRYFEMSAWVREQPPIFLSAKLVEEEIAEKAVLDHPFHFDNEVELLQEERPRPMRHFIDEIEQVMGPIPLSVRAWYEEVGAVNFFGYHAQWKELTPSYANRHPEGGGAYSLMNYCDPLQVCALDERCMAQIHQRYVPGKTYLFEFAPDRHFKDYCAGTSTPNAFVFPDAGVDAIIGTSYSSSTFVEYLRVSLKWAGFPGMMEWPTVPKEALAFLTHNLPPF